MFRTAGIGTKRAFVGAAVLACVATFAHVSPASAAGPWFVAVGGNNASNCTSAATPCATIIGALSKAGFVSGDTINVAAGTYTAATVAQLSIVGGKGANIVGQGAGAVLDANNLGSAFANAGNVTTRLTNLTLKNGSNNTSFGGGLRVQLGTVITQDVTITNNKSTLGGGAIVYPNATLTMNGGAVNSNTSTAVANQRGYGGGIYVFANGTLNVTGTTFTDNVADGSTFALAGLGGGIMNAGTATISGATLTGNRATGTGSLDGLGGGIYNQAALTLTNATIAGGTASANAIIGGGIVSSAFTATGLTVSGNTAAIGGGIYVNGNSTLTNSTITKNKTTQGTTGLGGGIDAVRPNATGTSTVVLDHTEVTENTSAAYGGGVAVGAGVTAQIKGGSTVARNVAPVGAGISTAGDLTVTGSHVDHNDAAYGGGALYLGSADANDRPKATLTDSTASQNTAAAYGGGAWVSAASTLTTDGAQVRGNTAVGGGGIIVADGGTVKSTGTEFTDNTASNFGGGALLTAGAVELTNSTLRANHAVHTTGTTGVGGAIYSGSSTANAATSLKITGSTIAENDAYAASAVVVASTGSGASNKTSISNSTITGNSTSSSVGAIQQYHPMSIIGSTITNNTSDSNSGAFYAVDPSKLSISGSIVAGNSGNECSLGGSSVADGGYNFSTDATCGFTAAKHDVIGNSPQLGPLADNGGPTLTQLPGPASPALDQIPSGTGTGQSDAISGNAVTLCVGTDQRGKARPQGAKCDMGSVEADQIAPTVDGPGEFDIALNVDMGSITYTSDGSPQATLSVDGDLPTGVSFTDNGDGTGKFTGKPTEGPGGERTVTVKATNEAGTGTKSVTIKLHEAPTLSGPSGDTYTVGEQGGPNLFEQTGGYPDATLSADGDLPDGVTFTPQSGGKGELGGTPQSGTGGVYSITIEGDNGTPPVAKWPFSLTVNEAPSLAGPSSANFTVGDAGSSAPFTAGGYPKPELSAVGLPAGLSISGTGEGSITGTPHDSTGGEYDATVRASNGIGSMATKSVHLTVKEAPELDGPDAVRFVENRNEATVYSSDGYPTATLTVSGDLPDGITFTDHGNGTATLGGNATTAAIGTYSLVVKASNGVAPDTSRSVTLTVVPKLGIATSSLPQAKYKTEYSATVSAVGGQPPYDFSLASGSLPAGLTLNSDGTITGTPTGTLSTSTFTVKVTDADNPEATATKTLSITVGKGDTHIVLEQLAVKITNNPLGVKVYLFTVNGTLFGGEPEAPIAGQTVSFSTPLNGKTYAICSGITKADGTVSCAKSLTNVAAWVVPLINGGRYTGTYAGNAHWNGTSTTRVHAWHGGDPGIQ